MTTDLRYIKNIGPKRVKLLEKLGIFSLADLLYYFPRRYEDRSNLKKFHQLQDGDTETIQGTVLACQEVRPRRGLNILKVALHDGVSVGYAVWFNQLFLKKQFNQGKELIISGRVEKKYGGIQISVSDYEVIDTEDPVHTGRIVPVYPTTEGLPQRTFRNIMKNVVDEHAGLLQEFMPRYLRQKYGWLPLTEAVSQIHFPASPDDLIQARKRLVFEELFLLQLGLAILKAGSHKNVQGIRHKPDGPLYQAFLDRLPFALTTAQQKVLSEIITDMEKENPMNRLVQGDVGSGKTVVAAAALVKTVASGCQGVLMAPTEILAEQHFEGLCELLEPLEIKVGLLTGSLTKKEKTAMLESIRKGAIDVLVGTHALIQEEVCFNRLGLAVTDEQHRFGVRQRARLQEKGTNPDVLVMTATPIPRTLALTLYGDLDISVINELPPGRRPVKTYWRTEKSLPKVYAFISQQVAAGRQAYVVCPLVEESEKIDVGAAVEMADRLTEVFPDYNIGLVHGRLKKSQKEAVMQRFRTGEVQVLVATTVIEVGVNIPNANIMLINDAERFGLAQLHQLRGRVGRGEHQSFCIMVANPKTDEGKARMKIMEQTTDGFILAEEDLQLRGPGEFFGTRQSGLPELKIADILRDTEVLELSRREAFALIAADPGLLQPDNVLLKEKIAEKFNVFSHHTIC